MKLFEFCQKTVLTGLTDEQRLFVTKLIMREVKIDALKRGISEQDAYFEFSRGLTAASQREIPSTE